MVRKWNFDPAPIRNQRRRGFDPKQGLLRDRFLTLARVIGVVQTNSHNFGWHHGDQRPNAFEFRRFFFERGRSENISYYPENFAINHLGVKNIVTLLKTAYRCHIAA